MGALGPGVGEAPAADPGDLHREHEVVGLEAGRPDHAVELAQAPVGGPQAVRLDALDRLGHELHVGALQSRQEGGAEEDPLAPEGVVRPRLGAHLLVLELGAHEAGRPQRHQAPERARVTDAQRQRLGVVEDEPTAVGLQAGDAFEGRPQPLRVAAVLARQEPVAGALEDAQGADPGRDLGDELDRAGAAADDRHALALELVVVVPFGRVEGVAGEVLQRPAGPGSPAGRAGRWRSRSRRTRRCCRRRPRTVQRQRCSSHEQAVTAVSVRIRGSMPWSRATSCR